MRNDQSASEVKIKFKTREGFWHKIDEFPDESKNGRKKSKNPKPNPNHVGTDGTISILGYGSRIFLSRGA